MNNIVWLLALVLLGLATGKIIGAGLAFTGGRTRYDLVAGFLGAVVVGVPLRVLGLTGYSAALPTLIVGVSAAMLATWLTRVVTWKPEPALLPESEPAQDGTLQLAQDVMAPSGGTRLSLSGGKLGAPLVVPR